MTTLPKSLQHLVDSAKLLGAIRLAVADPAQGVVIETLREAHALGLVEPLMVGDPRDIQIALEAADWRIPDDWIVPAETDSDAASAAVGLVRREKAEAVMKGRLHTDILMHALLDESRGLRLVGQRVSHLFLAQMSSYPKLLGITDAAINIAPDLSAKAQIVQNAVEFFRSIGHERPKVAVLSAVETVNPAIVSTLDAACLTLMARRGQIHGAIVDGPLAFDNAISVAAAKEKGIVSDVAGDADILLVPELVSGNILAKDLEYLAGAIIAGVVLGLSAPAVLTSRADPPAARLASIALAVLMHHRKSEAPVEHSHDDQCPHCSPQPEAACRPLPSRAHS